jgi:hypothetical protein
MLPSSEPERKRTPPGVIASDQTVDVCTTPPFSRAVYVSFIVSFAPEIDLGIESLVPKVAAQYQSPLSSAQILMELS